MPVLWRPDARHCDRRSRQTRISQIAQEDLPCLFVSSGKIYVLLGFEEGNTLSVFDSSTQHFADLHDRNMQGIAYILRPIDVEEERKASLRHSWVTGIVARFKQLLTLMLGLGFVTSLLGLALPIYTMAVYDKAVGADSIQVLIALTSGMVLIVTVDLMLRRIRGRAQAYFGARLDALISNNAFSQLLHMHVSMTESISIGGQLTRFRQLENIREAFTGPLANALIDLPFVFVFIVAIAVIAGPLAWIPLFLLVIYALLAAVAIPVIRRNLAQVAQARSKLQNMVMEALSNQRAIRDLSAEQIWIESFQKLTEDFGLKNLRTRAITFNTHTISQTLMSVAGVATVGVGTLQALNGSLSAGALIGSMALCWRVLNPMHQGFVSLTRLGQTMQSLDQVNRLMRLSVERIPNLLPSVYRHFQGKLELRRVVFAYPMTNEPVLRGLNCVIECGEVVAITGTSGSGKSSIFKVILGLYPIQGGAILADGRDIRQFDLGEWRHAVSYVPKNCDLFYGTVAQNLALSNPLATSIEIARAAKEAGVLDVEFEEFLPEDIETRLTRSRMLAMPEELKQRIILARAFAKPSPFYLFDSPGQNLSPSGVKGLVRKVNAIRGKSTIIIITQRPELINAADRVLHMTAGQIVWEGSPQAYMEKKSKAA
jgi:ATP-binding cassette subfamily C protein LapB